MKMLINKRVLTFLVIIILAALLRLYNLNSVPLGFSEDEASTGYNAFSILKTAKDETGKFLPLTFESFGDYKLPVPVYLTVPFIAVLGLNELAVRLVPALFGILTILLIFLLTQKLFKNQNVSLISAFLLAVSPWHVQLSRFGLAEILTMNLILIELVFLFSVSKYRLLSITITLVALLLTSPIAWVSLPLLFIWCYFNLKSLPKYEATGALSEYLKGLKRKQRQHTLYIEAVIQPSSSQINKIKKIIEKKVKITKIITAINSDILGGFKLKVGDEVWDESMLGKINQVKEAIIHGRFN